MLPELTLETSKVCAKGPKTKESIQLSSGPESIVRLCQIQSKAFDHLNFRYLSDIFKSFDIIWSLHLTRHSTASRGTGHRASSLPCTFSTTSKRSPGASNTTRHEKGRIALISQFWIILTYFDIFWHILTGSLEWHALILRICNSRGVNIVFKCFQDLSSYQWLASVMPRYQCMSWPRSVQVRRSAQVQVVPICWGETPQFHRTAVLLVVSNGVLLLNTQTASNMIKLLMAYKWSQKCWRQVCPQKSKWFKMRCADTLCTQNRLGRFGYALTFHRLVPWNLFQVLRQSGTEVFQLCMGGVTGAPAATRKTARSHGIMGKVQGPWPALWI